MPRKKKKKPKQITEDYEFQINDWETELSFGINQSQGRLENGNYWEYSCLHLKGTIITPIIKNAFKVVIRIHETPSIDDHWKEPASHKPPWGIGHMTMLRDGITLELFCFLPSRTFSYLPLAAAEGKIKSVAAYGEKLRYGRGNIYSISFSSKKDLG